MIVRTYYFLPSIPVSRVVRSSACWTAGSLDPTVVIILQLRCKFRNSFHSSHGGPINIPEAWSDALFQPVQHYLLSRFICIPNILLPRAGWASATPDGACPVLFSDCNVHDVAALPVCLPIFSSLLLLFRRFVNTYLFEKVVDI